MSEPTNKRLTMGVSAGLHIAAAAAHFIALALEGKQTPEESRTQFVAMCAEMYDETVAELPRG